MVMALGGLSMGCGDDSDPVPSADGSSGTESGSSSTGTATTTTGADDTGTDGASGDGDSGESSSSSSGEPPPVEVTLEGEVVDFAFMAPIPDAEISVYDDPAIMATADATGFFSIGPFQPDTSSIFVLAPTEDYWGAVIPIDIGSDPLQEDVELTQISTEIVDMQIMGLAGQNPAMPDLERAIIVVRLINNTAVTEGPTTIEMNPPPQPDTFYAPDAAGAPVLNANDIEFALIPVVVYFNIDDSDPGDITFTATHPLRECEILYPNIPTIGEHMTLVDVRCPAP